MLRVLGWSLVFVAGAATTASAASRFDHLAAGAVETALQQSAAIAGKAERPNEVRDDMVQLQVGGALALAQPALRATVPVPAVTGRRPADAFRTLALTPAASPTTWWGGAMPWLELRGARPTFVLPLTDSLSLGLAYRYVRVEDLDFKAAKTGLLAPDYQSHNVLLRARWEF
jgi:hypothetical protein